MNDPTAPSERYLQGMGTRRAVLGDEGALAGAVATASSLARAACRSDAARHDLARMLDAHETLYRRIAG